MKRNLSIFVMVLLSTIHVWAQESALDKLVIQDGICQITTVEDLQNFALAVNEGNNTLSAVLTSDIDLTDTVFPMIGTTSIFYAGTFDGQRHTITLNQTATQLHYGLFCIIENATIRNLKVCGDITTDFRLTAGLSSKIISSTIENCISSVNITSTFAGDAAYAGFTGWAVNSTIKDCVFDGSIKGETANYCGGICSWSDNTTFQNCLVTADIETGLDTWVITRNPNGAKLENTYYLPVNDVLVINDGSTSVTEEQLKSGEVCYLLNGNQSNIQWTQNIGEDNMPLPWKIRNTVYVQAEVDCTGKPVGSEYSYSNSGSINVPPHSYEDGQCTVCGKLDESFITPEDDFYKIGSAGELVWLSRMVAAGHIMNVKLTSDIDVTDIEFPTIGASGIHYTGTFDGQGHTITFDQIGTQHYSGLLFTVAENAIIKNLHVAGNLTTDYQIIGAIAGQLISTRVENCISSVNIVSNYAGNAACGGICGWAISCTINNCLFNGTISGEKAQHCAGITAWSEGVVSITNCLQIGSFAIDTTAGDTSYDIARHIECVSCNNVFYLNPLTFANASTTQISQEQLESGEVCALLNAGQTEMQWTQTIGEDEFPVPNLSRSKVYIFGDVVMNVETDADFGQFRDAVCDAEYEYCKSVLAQKELIAQYEGVLKQFEECASLEELLALFGEANRYREQVLKSEAAYTEYMKKVDDTIAFLEANPDLGLGVDYRDILESYLNDYETPGDVFVNGSVSYITDVALLNEDGLQQEKSWIDQMLDIIAMTSAAPGSEVTLLLKNSDFSNGFIGWNGTTATGYSVSGTGRVVECVNNTMDMYQTISGIKNGVYELKINGAFSPSPLNDFYNTNYAAMFYANGNVNYFQAAIEGMVPVSDASDGQNCSIAEDNAVENLEGNVIGYTVKTLNGCNVAFQAGRYQNSVLVNVTDGTLTVGIKQPGTGHQPEWLGFGNIQLIYCGTIEEADGNLNHVLASQSDRANTILNNYEFSLGDDYSYYPNFSQELKNELKACLEAVENTSDPAGKYALVEKFSDLFQKIYDSKKDYISLMQQYIALSDLSGSVMPYLDENEKNEVNNLLDVLSNAYFDGSLNSEDCKKSFIEQLSFLPSADSEYSIGSAKNLQLFAIYVNTINASGNAKLTADIDLTDCDFPMIGTTYRHYAGTFDGQGHTIILNQTATQEYYGLFCFLENATIRNLKVGGDIITEHRLTSGFSGKTISSTIENCISSVNIISTYSGDAAYAGFTGWAVNSLIKDCVFDGSMKGENANYCGGICSWSDNTTFQNCLVTADIKVGLDTWVITRNPNGAKLENTYYLPVNDKLVINQGSQSVTEEQLKSGEVCFKLNRSQSDIVQWTQNIGEDNMPLPWNTHNIVYVQGELDCGGRLISEEYSFSNAGGATKPSHTYETGICTVCGSVDESFMTPEDDFYKIGSAGELVWLSKMVAAGHTMNVKITSDIDVTDIDFPMIGSSAIHYTGTFDGQGHTITFNQTGTQEFFGLFIMAENAIIKNLHTAGNITSNYNLVGGIAGKLISTRVENCISSVNIVCNVVGNAACGGICGWAVNSTFNNCLFDGSISGEKARHCGGLTAWSEGLVSITNCLQIARFAIDNTGDDTSYDIARNVSNVSCDNVFYLNPLTFANASTTLITQGQLESGEVCFLLNGDQSDIQWTQKLGEDAYPIPFLTRDGVAKKEDGTFENYDLSPVRNIDAEKTHTPTIYNLMGQKVSKAGKGVYIIDGKKIFIHK